MFRSCNRQSSKSLSFLLCFSLGLGTVSSLELATPASAAIPWFQLLFQGAQLYQVSHLSTQQRVQLGQEIHQQVLSEYSLDSNPRTNSYVNRIGQRLARVSDCPSTPFHFYVVQDPNINAFSTTGGFVYVNTGLLKAVDNEAQLAAVIGHEMGHICNNDLIHKIQQSDVTQGLASASGLDRSTVANLGLKLAVDLPNSRQDEFNADAKGLQYIERAGYDPHAMIAFLSKLLKASSPPAFLSDHPATRERIAVLQRKIAASQ